MTGGNYSNVSTVLAGSRIYASILKTAIEAIDQTVYDKVGGGTGTVVTNLVTVKPTSAILASDVPAIALAASFSATGKGHTIDWNINGRTEHPLRIAGMFNADGVGMDMVFYTNQYVSDGVERMRIDKAGKVSLTGDFAHGGTNLGFYGQTPAARPSAYTQTYATTTRTHANATSSTLSVSVGTGSTTIPNVGAAFSQTTLNNIVRSLADQINNLRADLIVVKNLLNQVIDDQQANGLFQ